MERFTTIPTIAADLVLLAQQMLDSSPTYDAEFEPAVLTAKRTVVSTGITDTDTKQGDADTKKATYEAARNVYYAARDLLNSAKESLGDAADSLRNHIMHAVSVATAGMSAEDLATFETDVGLALLEPLSYLPPVAPVVVAKKFISGATAWINWNPVLADELGHCSASAYQVQKSADGVTWDFEAVVVNTEVYVVTTGMSHYKIIPHGDAGAGTATEILGADFDPAS